jgi:hypothetical protein
MIRYKGDSRPDNAKVRTSLTKWNEVGNDDLSHTHYPTASYALNGFKTVTVSFDKLNTGE